MAVEVVVQMVFTVYGARDNKWGQIHIDLTSDVALSSEDVPDLMQTVWDFIKPLQNGRLGGASFNIQCFWKMPEALDPTNVAATISDVEEKAEFDWYGDDNADRALFTIPCFREEKFLGFGQDRFVNLGDPDVAAFVIAMTNGIPIGGGNTLYNSSIRGVPMTRIIKTPKQRWGR